MDKIINSTTYGIIRKSKIQYLQESIEKMRLDTINFKNKEIITPMGKSYCNARIQAFNDVLEIMEELWKIHS